LVEDVEAAAAAADAFRESPAGVSRVEEILGRPARE
jgi:hypothetical protein